MIRNMWSAETLWQQWNLWKEDGGQGSNPRSNRNFKLVAPICSTTVYTAWATTWMASHLVRASQESDTSTPPCIMTVPLSKSKLQNKPNRSKKLTQKRCYSDDDFYGNNRGILFQYNSTLGLLCWFTHALRRGLRIVDMNITLTWHYFSLKGHNAPEHTRVCG